jgi:hypothetical protein
VGLTFVVQYVLIGVQPCRDPVPTAARVTWVWVKDRSTNVIGPVQS